MLDEVKKLIKENKLIIGTNETVSGLKNNSIKKVWLSSNSPKNVRDEINHYAKLNNAIVEELELPNDELGILCKKQFSVSVVSEGE